MTKAIATILLSAAVLCGCASTPDPAKVCTAEWIAPRAERAAEKLESKTARAFRSLRKVGGSWVAGDTPGPLAMLSLKSSFNSLEKEIKNGQGVKDLRTLAATCDDPELVRGQIVKLLDGQNLPEPVINFLRDTSLIDRLVRLAEGADATT